jgi:DNA-binding transcriptional regulator YdaS (Cro superfamily)
MKPADLLKALIDSRYNGSQAAFARAIGRKPSQVNQWLSGHRRLDIKGQRIIEDALNIDGYFSGSAAKQTVAEPLPAPYIHPNEIIRQIISLCEQTDDAGRGIALMAVGQALEKYRPPTAKRA